VRQSNLYVILFSAGLTIVIGGLLALAAVFLRPIQKEQVALDTRARILGAVMPIDKNKDDVVGIYNSRISSIVVDINGNVVDRNNLGEAIVAENVDIAKQFKQNPPERLYPVFRFMSKENPDEVDAYIVPVFGNGLWDRIWGYVALEPDLVTVRGVSFDHAGETPGLGARITDESVQQRYIGKKIYNNIGELVSIRMVKAETGQPGLYGEHEVDGISGSTMTAKGVNAMLMNYFNYYQAYFNKIREAQGEDPIEIPDAEDREKGTLPAEESDLDPTN
jgi:Na+-transporting NADH:ubiquinone oxidoreductase subunit C